MDNMAADVELDSNPDLFLCWSTSVATRNYNLTTM